MARKATKEKQASNGPYTEPRKAVRLFLLEDEHRAVRIAAAATGLAMSEFCRQAAMEKAEKTKID